MPDNTMMLGAGGGMAPTLESTERGLTVSSVMKEIAVLKDKFKMDDEDHCTLLFNTMRCHSIRFDRLLGCVSLPSTLCCCASLDWLHGVWCSLSHDNTLHPLQSPRTKTWRRRRCCRSAASSTTPTW